MKERIAYILNPEKTEDMFWCNSYNCMTNAEDAYLNRKFIYENFTHRKFNQPVPENGKARVKLLHYVQSFSPDDNVDPALAHRIGLSLMRKAFGDNVQAVVATHVDKAHIHNHLILNVYGIDGRKFNSNKKTLAEIREHSDRVCLAFGIQPIMNNKHLGMTYKEWDARRKGTSWKEKIKKEIDTLTNQKDILLRYAKENGFLNPQIYVDDGYSGTNFDRPDFQRMKADIENGKVSTVIVKDLSRLGREYLQTGYYTEMFFPEHGVRFIAIHDNVDTNLGDNDFAPFKNIINEFYPSLSKSRFMPPLRKY